MVRERVRPLLVQGIVLGILGGCAGIPPGPPQQVNQARSADDDGEGWLFRSLTKGRPESPQETAPPSPTGSAVVPASASLVEPNATGPLIPGPASPTPRQSAESPSTYAVLSTVPPETPAGPPPFVPPELPSPTTNAVSIGDAKIVEDTKKKSGFELSDLAPENIYNNMKNAAGYGPDEKIARAAMQQGEALYREKKYHEAASQFATAAKRWPDSPLEERALFMQGESEFFADEYPKAHDTFGGLLKKYSNTRYLDTVSARQFAMGRYWEQMYKAKPTWPTTPNFTDNTRPWFDTFGWAIQAYERVRIHDPTGPLADDSVMALANLYFRHGRYEDAAYYYGLLCKEYANSEHQKNAHILGIQANMRRYQGTVYDEQPLKDANRLTDQTLKQFGKSLGKERERILTSRAQILEEQANREFTRGQYYEKRKCYGAARIYYQSVVQEYPSTQMAKDAQARLEAIRNEPDQPPNHMKWFTGLFESEE